MESTDNTSSSAAPPLPPPLPPAEEHQQEQQPESTASSIPPRVIDLATQLFEAARKGRTDILKQTFAIRNLANLTNHKGDSLIMLASYHGHAELVEFLLQHNADPNQVNLRQQSPLSGAIFHREKRVVEELLKGGADPRIGIPSAVDIVEQKLFGFEEDWADLMNQAVKELEARERREGELGNGRVEANGGVEGEREL